MYNPKEDLFSHFASLHEQEEREKVDTAEDFSGWKQSPGAKQVLRHCYRRAAYYYNRDFKRSGLPVSVKLIWEEVRQQIKRGRLRMKQKGMDLPKYRGYRLNNNFSADIARHILEHKPDWQGLFELRERK